MQAEDTGYSHVIKHLLKKESQADKVSREFLFTEKC